MKNIFTLIMILMVSVFVQSQNSLEKKYNLPPGAVLQNKGVKENDLSYKLKTENFQNNHLADNFLRKFSHDVITQMENEKGEDYYYYYKANEYFLSLSEKVRKIYTYEELWFIYMFDQNLKQRLTTI